MTVTVRPATPADVAGMSRVFVDTFRAAHAGQVPEALLLERTYDTSARGWERSLREPDPGQHLLVAVDVSGDVVGLALGGAARPWPADDAARTGRPTGECQALYVDVAHHHGGVGRALLAALAASLVADGVRRLLVAVLAVNEPARAFYEAVGGVLLGERVVDDSGVALEEVVYVWDDVPALASSTA